MIGDKVNWSGKKKKKKKSCAGPRAREKIKGVKKAVYPGPKLNLSLHPPALSSPPAPEEGLGQGWHGRSSVSLWPSSHTCSFHFPAHKLCVNGQWPEGLMGLGEQVS